MWWIKRLFCILILTVPFWGASAGEVEAILCYQRSNGGWPKNIDYSSKWDEVAVLKEKKKTDTTFDNNATVSEMRKLAKAYRKTNKRKYKEAFIRGLRFCLEAQYPNGGWPQFYPEKKGYHGHITFNDKAMINVMELLQDVSSDDDYGFVDKRLRIASGRAVEKGIDCILKCQIRIDGKLAVWCAQHDSNTLKPAKARAYELAAYSGWESVGIVRFLMQIESPSKAVVRSVEGAVQWFEEYKIRGYRIENKRDISTPKGYDRVLVKDRNAPFLWARFYDLNTVKPIYCDRDGAVKDELSKISYERRNGYNYIDSFAQTLLENDYPEWRKRMK